MDWATATPWLLALMTAVNLWLVKMSNDAKSERKVTQDMIAADAKELHEFKIEVAKTYATREAIDERFDRVEMKIDKIYDRIDHALNRVGKS